MLEDDLNPVGTAVIEMDSHTHQFYSVIFVQSTTYVEKGVHFSTMGHHEIIHWIEQETGFIYGKQFQLQKEEAGKLLFHAVFEGIKVSPTGIIEIKYDRKGNLTLFSISGHFPTEEYVQKETYTLDINQVEPFLKEHLHRINFPSEEREELIPIYGVEEVFITHATRKKIPFEVFDDGTPHINVNQKVFYDEVLNDTFEAQAIHPLEEITVEQAFSLEPSPAVFPMTKEEQEACLIAVRDFLRQKYPEDSGRWIVKTLHRETDYIHAILELDQPKDIVFQRKLTVIIDASDYRVINYVDNAGLLEMFEQYQGPETINVTKGEAYEKLKDLYVLQPYYVYDFDQKKYILCGKIDCLYGVDATKGRVILLEDL